MRISQWTEEKIKAGFERFNKEYGRLPMALEVDRVPYLPSSRWIQIKYGGLEKLRLALGFNDTHFGKGAFRSQIAHRVNGRGRAIELDLERLLRARFGEVFVHTERVFGERKYRLDFYVYSPDGNFGIDVFYPDTLASMQSGVNIKMNKYRHFNQQLFLVVANRDIKQTDINSYSSSKMRVLPSNIQIVTWDTFCNLMEFKRSYPNPL